MISCTNSEYSYFFLSTKFSFKWLNVVDLVNDSNEYHFDLTAWIREIAIGRNPHFENCDTK